MTQSFLPQDHTELARHNVRNSWQFIINLRCKSSCISIIAFLATAVHKRSSFYVVAKVSVRQELCVRTLVKSHTRSTYTENAAVGKKARKSIRTSRGSLKFAIVAAPAIIAAYIFSALFCPTESISAVTGKKREGLTNGCTCCRQQGEREKDQKLNLTNMVSSDLPTQ